MFLRELLAGRKAHHASGPRMFAVATVLCLVLLALLAVVQIAHVHPLETDADHCPLCIVLHAVTPVTVTAAAVILVQVGAPIPSLESRAVIRHWLPSLFTRPPPFSC
jgi:hypothetical protein